MPKPTKSRKRAAAANRTIISPLKLHRPQAAAEILQISRSMLYDLMARGEISYCRVGADRRIPESAIAAFIAARTVAER